MMFALNVCGEKQSWISYRENGKAEMIEEVESVFYECLIQLLFEKFEERFSEGKILSEIWIYKTSYLTLEIPEYQ